MGDAGSNRISGRAKGSVGPGSENAVLFEGDGAGMIGASTGGSALKDRETKDGCCPSCIASMGSKLRSGPKIGGRSSPKLVISDGAGSRNCESRGSVECGSLKDLDGIGIEDPDDVEDSDTSASNESEDPKRSLGGRGGGDGTSEPVGVGVLARSSSAPELENDSFTIDGL
jgi:hypothetical protein